jgi:glycosyltransferase involved in cell wall biosynthesis
MPTVSIITVNLDNREGLAATIASVAGQTCRDFEHIVVDGGSTDGSVEIIREHDADVTRWISERDHGIYEAMNKGIRMAGGDYCLFLNSGDRLVASDVLERILGPGWPGTDIVYGDLQTPSGRCSYPGSITLGTFFRTSIAHPSALIRRTLFDRCGYYNERLRIAADWEFFIAAIVLHGCTYAHVDQVISYFDDGGVSSRETATAILNGERDEVLRRLVPAMYDDYLQHIRDEDELRYYRRSRLVQLVRAFQSSSLYLAMRPGRRRTGAGS